MLRYSLGRLLQHALFPKIAEKDDQKIPPFFSSTADSVENHSSSYSGFVVHVHPILYVLTIQEILNFVSARAVMHDIILFTEFCRSVLTKQKIQQNYFNS